MFSSFRNVVYENATIAKKMISNTNGWIDCGSEPSIAKPKIRPIITTTKNIPGINKTSFCALIAAMASNILTVTNAPPMSALIVDMPAIPIGDSDT